MATVEAHQDLSTDVEMLLGRKVCYQKHKPGKHLSVEMMPKGFFQIESIAHFGSRIVVNDGVIVMENAPAVIERRGRIALLLHTGEELFLYTE